MKISELINILNEYKEKYGDIDVYLTKVNSNNIDMIRTPHVYYSKEYTYKYIAIK